MTQAPEQEAPPVPEGHVRLTIDDRTVDAPKGELLIRTCERLGIVVPRFCDHPLLEPAGACRQCLVEVEMGGRPMPKPQASCTMTVADGMVVRTQVTSAVADKAQQGVMELLLINHPLDCPICDKGGECPLQNQAMSSGRAESRFHEHKRHFEKPLPISDEVLLDRERCVLCQRCTRFSDQIAGDPFIELLERGAHQQIGTEETAWGAGEEFQSYFSGNTIQICPVGALTSASYRFRSRPFDLVSTPGQCEHCASGCSTRRDWRRGGVTRVLAGEEPTVNEEWLCDKGRFAFRYPTSPQRVLQPMVREDGVLTPVPWVDALERAAALLAAARDGAGAPRTDEDGTEHGAKSGVGVLPGGRLTVEDAYAYAKFARVALRTNDVDQRARAHSDEELDFLAGHVAGVAPSHVSYAHLEAARTVLCVAFDPEEESPIVFLRLRKASRHGTRVVHVGSWTTPAVAKTGGHLLGAAPGEEAAALSDLPDDLAAALAAPGAVVLVGERAAEVPGLLTAVSELGARTGARIAWVPRRAGERGGVDAGALPTLLPGARRVDDAAAREAVAEVWGVPALPTTPGRDLTAILTAARDGELAGLVVGGVELADLPDPELARAALAEADVVISLEQVFSEATEHADVVLPVAPAVNRSGTYRNWEGRDRPFATTIDPGQGGSGRVGGTAAVTLPDCRVLDSLAVEMDVDLFTQTPQAAAAELAELGTVAVTPSTPATRPSTPAAPVGGSSVRLATWRQLIDGGALLAEENDLPGTARPARLRVAADTAERLGLVAGEPARIGEALDLVVELADLPADVVWAPSHVPVAGGVVTLAGLGLHHGGAVEVRGPAATTPATTPVVGNGGPQ
ncbi:NADH-quinone oxidoreductase subunit G [Actinomycetospora corticicola]|uniref:NADH-quinone oxidoreductase n=1 Tax=Actinomycetospora corticicola TaxID=663602 RepID=A0A7Y9J7W6_9PSEU|nr:NADH-quinone oxidoreductase subunit G [Actinomycetospora corticicola]NYD37824.1 NADH-quinone oxidoreductase subunit G [Actinomycetospora corticicola]